MKSRVLLLFLTILVVASLGLLSCQQAAPASAQPPAKSEAKPEAAKPASASTPATSKPASTSEEIKIGFVGPFSGAGAVNGASMKNAAELAASQWNAAGGLLGRPVKLIFGDDASDPSQAVSVFERFVSQDKVVAIVGCYASSACLAAQQVSEKAHIPFVLGGAIGGSITGPGKKYTFRSYPTFGMELPQLGEYLVKEAKFKTFGIIVEQTDAGEDIRKVFGEAVQKNGGKVVSNESAPLGSKDYYSQLTKMKAADPEVLMIGFGPLQDIALVVKQSRELGLKSEFAAVESMATDALFQQVGDAAEGAIMTSFFEADQASTPSAKKFVEDYQSRYGKPPDYLAAKAYEGIDLLKNAIERAKSAEPEKIREALAATKDVPGLTSPTTIGEDGQAVKKALIVQVKSQKRVVIFK